MIDREHDLPITKQAEILEVSRGSVYYLPRPVSSADLAIMQRLDRLHLEYPFAGSRTLRGLLALQGCKIGRRHVKTLMRRMGIEAHYRRPRTTKPEPGHKIYPYLLRGIELTRPNQVWAMDITSFRWRMASSISPWCWTGRHVVFCHGGCRSRWRRRSASRRWRMLSRVMVGRKSSTPTRVRSSRARRSPVSSRFSAPVTKLNDLLASPKFLSDLSYITGIPRLLADEQLLGGGIHITGPGGRLDVHVDFNFIKDRQLHRRLNLLLYLNDPWQPNWGGQFQLWDKEVKNCEAVFDPVFNRCIIFETNEVSFHGVVPISPSAPAPRKSFAVYYYTKEVPSHWSGVSHSTTFKARPEEKIKGLLLMPAETITK
jgi:hypothetical protein